MRGARWRRPSHPGKDLFGEAGSTRGCGIRQPFICEYGMRSAVLTVLGFAMVAAGLAVLAVLFGNLAGEVRGFGIILIGPIPIIVSDGASLPAVMLLSVALFLLFAFLVLRGLLRGSKQD